MRLFNEVYVEGKGWRLVGELSEGQAASLSSEHPTRGRQIYMFGWVNGKGPALWRSTLGVDEEVGPMRLTTTLGLKKLVTLSQNPHVRIIYNARFGPQKMRFTVKP